MLTGILILLLVLKNIEGQVNGEFWWLSKKVSDFKGVTQPPAPKFEVLSEFDTDESAKIIFRDDNLISSENTLENADTDIKTSDVIKSDNINTESIVWPDEFQKTFISNTKKNNNNMFTFTPLQTSTAKVNKKKKQDIGDIFIFRYPEDNNIRLPLKADLVEQNSNSNDNISETILKPMSKEENKETEVNETTQHYGKDKIHKTDLFTFKFPDDNLLTKNSTADSLQKLENSDENVNLLYNNEIINSSHDEAVFSNGDSSFTENICSFMDKHECYQNNGVVHTSTKASAKNENRVHLVCCVLPLSTKDYDKIVFPDSPEMLSRRLRRAVKEEPANTALKQRDFILRQKYRPQTTSPRPTGLQKVGTPDYDDYVDPYLNIKGSSLKKQAQSSKNKDCSYSDYVEDYVVELPKPGLVGIYSDHANTPWSFANEPNNRPSYGGTFDESDEDDDEPFGYSTVDPRRGSSKSPKRGRPLKITTTSPDEVTYNPESQTVSFQSSPNFQVLQGFKLLNLGRTTNKFYSKTTRRSTVEGSFENESKEQEETVSHAGVYHGNLNDQVYENCGKTRKILEDENTDKQFGNAENGSHPWMGLVVLTRRPQGILCYATIVHPRVAVTTGDCIYGRTSPKEVTLIAGLWNLSDRSRTQNRVVTTQLHPQYRAKVLAHDLALLHWKSPLRLNANIQPACLGNVRQAEDCKFFGWGGFDQGIRPRSRWQRATILSSQECTARLSKAVTMPDDGFCATVQSRGTVTGIGGPLICNVHGRKTTTGIAVWRDNALLLIPAQEWIIRALQDLNIE